MSFHIAVLLIVSTITAANATPTVKIRQGVLKGKPWKTKEGREFNAFLSIPFAEPPVGNLRFQSPVPAGPWEGVRDATQNHALCPQRNIYTRSDVIEGEEDCLYLNVYAPKLLEEERQKLYPVMVFIHGGGWLCCSGNSIYYGPDVLLDRDVILVVVNYRLGAFGFLSTGDEVVPGNNGLKDQSLALRWVKENIKQFGGDPEKITVFGESAGGSSTHFHMISPLSRGLIKGGISQSGTAFTSWSLSQNGETQKNSKKLARALNCPDSPSTKMVDCLRNIDPHRIIAQDKIFMEWDTDPMIPFKPVIEPDVKGAFLSEHPLDIIRNGKIADIPWVTGITTGDGALRSAGIFGNPEVFEEFKDRLEEVLPFSLIYHHIFSDTKPLTEQIKQFYLKDGINRESRMNVTDLFTDAWFLEGTDRAVKLHLQYAKSPVYLYLFGYRGTASYTELFGDPHNDYGACHADELQYLFPVRDLLFPGKKPSENDRKMARLMTNLWVNFAKTGNPTKDLESIPIPEEWKPVRSIDEMEYYYIQDHENLTMSKGLHQDRVIFWRNLALYSRNELSTDRRLDEL